MGIADCVIVGLVALWLTAALYFLHRKKKSCGCAGCSGACAAAGCTGCGRRK